MTIWHVKKNIIYIYEKSFWMNLFYIFRFCPKIQPCQHRIFIIEYYQATEKVSTSNSLGKGVFA